MERSPKFGHFTLLEEIGAGGMGTVFKAFDESLQRQVAIKLLHEQFAQDPKFVQDFLREARNAAAISHPHIVHVHFVGEEAGQYYVVMELLKGRTLREMIEADGPLAEERALQITADVAEALGAAYQNNQLIHGDIKPANIFVTADAGAKVLDFGLAKLADVEAPATGEVWGSPYYMSPERVGRKAEDFRSDIYSLGATLFHALTGRPPFDAETPEELALKRLNARAPGICELKPELTQETDQVVAKMLSKSPLTRYRDYNHLRGQLDEAKTGATAKRLGIHLATGATLPQGAEPAPAPAPTATGPPRWIWIVAIGAVAVIAAIILALVLRRPVAPPRRPPVPTNNVVPPKPPPAEMVGPTAQELEQLRRKYEQAKLEAAQQEQRRLAAADKKLLQTAETDATPLWQKYDFPAVTAQYEGLLPQLQTADAKQRASRELLRARHLTDFKAQLMTDIAARPYERGDMVTRADTRLLGALVSASEIELTFRTEYGEHATPWSEVAPLSLYLLAKSYAATLGAAESDDLRARREKLMDAFARQYKLYAPAPRPGTPPQPQPGSPPPPKPKP